MNNENLKLKNEEYKAKILPTIVDRIFALAEDKRFTLLRFPNQLSRAVVRSASSTAAPLSLSLYRPQDALGDNAPAARAALEAETCFCKKMSPRKSVSSFSGGGQEIRNTPEAFHLVPRSSKKSGFKPFLHFHISRVFTAFHQNKGHIKDTERSSSTAAVIRQRLFFVSQVFKKSISIGTCRSKYSLKN